MEDFSKGTRLSLRERFAAALARLLIRIFYRRIEVRHLDRLAASGPVVFVSNHANALIDPILLIAALPRPPRFLGKSTLWNNALLRPLLWLGGVIPIYRSQDGSQMSQNEQTFVACHEELARGGAIALFPEGISSHAPQLQPLKTGAARIVLGAERALGPLGARIVPVGLTYETKGVFRSRVLVTVGEAIEPELPGAASAAGGEIDHQTVRELTAEILRGLREVTLNFDSWTEGRWVERAVEVYVGALGELPRRPELGDRFGLRQRFGAGYAELRAMDPERCEALVQATASYDQELDQLGLRDDQVSARYPGGRVLRYLGTHLSLQLLWLPVAALGTLLNYLPYRAAGWIADRFDEGSADMPATLKLLSSLLLMPLVWLLESVIAAWLWGPFAGLACAVIAPVSGYIALYFHERHRAFWEEVQAYWVMRLRKRRVAALRSKRDALRNELDSLVTEFGESA